MSRHRRAAVAAFAFLTRLPVSTLAAHDAMDLPLGTVYFPIIGLVIAAIGGSVYTISHFFWDVPLAVVLSIAATVVATGAFHEDALADAFDGFGGGWTRDQVLAIMKDSRVGSYALVGLTLTLALKALALVAIATHAEAANTGPISAAAAFTRALVAGHVLGRWSSVPLMWRHAYVRPTNDESRPSAGQPFAGGVTLSRLAIVSLVAFGILLAMLARQALLPVAVAAVVTVLASRYFGRRLGGVTGDALGAANQIVEVCVYLTLAARGPV